MRARCSADLHPGTKSRPLYAASLRQADLIVSDGHPLPSALSDVCTVMLADLPAALKASHVGVRLLAVGSEAHLWDTVRVATYAGLHLDAIALLPSGATRRVQCIHCKACVEGVATPELDCSGCGLRLLVRDHFSRRLGAFQGVARHGVTRGEGG